MIALPMAPAERAERLTGRPSLSFSSISTFQTCPLKWYFRYVVGLDEETRSANLVFGSAIHAALQRHFEVLLIDGTPPSLDELVKAFRSSWSAESEGVVYGKGDTAGSLADLATKMLRVFGRSDLARPEGRIVAIEEELIGEMSPGCPPLLARLDLAVETDDAMTITDFKTSRTRWSQEQAEDSSTQLLVYRELAEPLADGKPIRLQFGVLSKTKEPSVETFGVADNPRQVDRIRRIIERVWDAIQAEHYYPIPSPMQCPTCSYRNACRSWSG